MMIKPKSKSSFDFGFDYLFIDQSRSCLIKLFFSITALEFFQEEMPDWFDPFQRKGGRLL